MKEQYEINYDTHLLREIHDNVLKELLRLDDTPNNTLLCSSLLSITKEFSDKLTCAFWDEVVREYPELEGLELNYDSRERIVQKRKDTKGENHDDMVDALKYAMKSGF